MDYIIISNVSLLDIVLRYFKTVGNSSIIYQKYFRTEELIRRFLHQISLFLSHGSSLIASIFQNTSVSLTLPMNSDTPNLYNYQDCSDFDEPKQDVNVLEYENNLNISIIFYSIE